ncbi:MAG TPA: hypothetical protein VFW89_05435 [Gemmatimonadaceae bacterium]|nr:hypothetical protein [Gemmatimonadaceae bacterium]
MTGRESARNGPSRSARPPRPARPPRTAQSETTPARTGPAARIAQPHGGALLPGGLLGHRGGTGRPRSVARAAALEGAEAAIPILRALLEQPKGRHATKIAAAVALLRYGLGTVRELSVDEVREQLRRTIDVIRQELPADQAESLLALIRPIWVR